MNRAEVVGLARELGWAEHVAYVADCEYREALAELAAARCKDARTRYRADYIADYAARYAGERRGVAYRLALTLADCGGAS